MTAKKYPGISKGEAISLALRGHDVSVETRARISANRTGVVKHGHSTATYTSPTYNSWSNMIQRCTNPNNTNYWTYGARGIQVCAEWVFFENFLADMGERPEGMTLDRIDNDGSYEPGNCRWATRSQQQLNRSGFRHSEETRAKISATKRARRAPR